MKLGWPLSGSRHGVARAFAAFTLLAVSLSEPIAARSQEIPSDAGWRAAEVVQAPASAGVTPAGLPKRVPRANLVPGTAQESSAGQPARPQVPVRSAAATRDRLASYQRGVRRARAAASEAGGEGGEDETSQ